MAELNGEPPPIAVVVRRGERVESEHRVTYAVAASDGRLLQVAGEVDRPIFPRSAIKPLQAIPLLESGAAERFALTPASKSTFGSFRNGSRAWASTGPPWSAAPIRPSMPPPPRAWSRRDARPNASITIAPASTPA